MPTIANANEPTNVDRAFCEVGSSTSNWVARGVAFVVAEPYAATIAVSENVVAGTVMTRRASYMYGALLPKGPRGHVDAGLGKGVPLLADQGLIAPTEEVAETGTELVVDGVSQPE